MRGTLLATDVDWDYASDNLSATPHKYIEAIVMGGDVHVFTHLLLPTIFGYWMDSKREQQVAAVIRSVDDNQHRLLLFQQDNVLKMCVYCLKQVTVNDKRPYQAVIRLIGGRDTVGWRYDWLFGILCRGCQTRPHYKLLYMENSDDDFVEMSECIEEYIFSESVRVEDYIGKPDKKSSPMERLYLALTKSYLARLEKANMTASLAICLRMQKHRECYHCNGEHDEDPKDPLGNTHICMSCGVVSFCEEDQKVASIYHGPLCKDLQGEGCRVFDIERSQIVKRKSIL